MHRLMGVGAALISALAAVALPAGAQSLLVSPTVIGIPAGKRGAVIEITNMATSAVDVQVRPYEWRQENGIDTLIDGADLVSSPSIVTIPSGGKQLVRLLASTRDRAVEANWRILIDQLPGPVKEQGLQIRLRLSVPVFAYPTKSGGSELKWSAAADYIEVINTGSRFARLSSLMVRERSGREIALPLERTPYLLPGTRRRWKFAAASLVEPVIVGKLGSADFTAYVSLAPVR